MATLAKLTSLSTQTLSLLLERQRLQSLGPNGSSLHLPQISRNLTQLHNGVTELEEKEGNIEAVGLLKSQYERMRNMLGPEAETSGIPRLQEATHVAVSSTSATASSSSLPLSKPSTLQPVNPPAPSFKYTDSDGPYMPYTDDPEAVIPSTDIMLQTQRRMMDEQDIHLDHLSHSINRQRDISLQINDELDVHTGLLQELDEDLDHTDSRLTRARRNLDKVAKGAKENNLNELQEKLITLHWKICTIITAMGQQSPTGSGIAKSSTKNHILPDPTTIKYAEVGGHIIKSLFSSKSKLDRYRAYLPAPSEETSRVLNLLTAQRINSVLGHWWGSNDYSLETLALGFDELLKMPGSPFTAKEKRVAKQ
ncbi:hypothetical protein PHLCEN_2v5630 [Hermanssonia centrifuga]|uniref:t-SNARE coiled-coil homology domain-containing protein n=1 Tax=Hermanssonia centrifuga TaxID=98765 RepID=A0A2R6P1T0_9APHY|nr:hypothetical protein PHLCEN_2v5630 [Hermanssonia centrifuga]